MPKKPNLPAIVHDHFRKANVLHGYTEKDMSAGTKHALETGQELLAAKDALPHGGWETACERLFDASLRTAQFYMQFTKNFVALPKAQQSAIMLLEGTLDGAAKAAKKAASPKSSSSPPKPKPKPPTPPDILDADSEPVADEPPAEETPKDYGKCPNCAGTKWDDDYEDVTCSKCGHPHGEPAGDVDDEPPAKETPEPPPKAKGKPPKAKGKPPKQFDRSYWYRQYDQAIGPLCRLVDKIANNIGESGCDSKKVVQSRLNGATEKMAEWMKVKPK